MTINPTCDKCKKELDDFGALLFSPPDRESNVKKFHLCKDCYNSLVQKLE
jgi:hypothetical protein